MSQVLDTVTISSRFNGPPESGNGGYTCGLLAQYLQGDVEVTLRVPPPLERSLAVVKTELGVELRDGEVVVAQAKQVSLQVDVPAPPNLDDAKQAAAHYVGFHSH